MTEQNRDDETRPLPVDDTQRLPVDDESQQLPASDATQPLERESGETGRLPIRDDTEAAYTSAPAPSSGRYDDPLAIFDEPRSTAEPVTGQYGPGTTGTRTGIDSDTTAAAVPLGTIAPPTRSGPRTVTIVWGFLVLAVGLGLVADAAGAHIDVELAAIILLALAGVVLVVGSIVSAVRRRRS